MRDSHDDACRLVDGMEDDSMICVTGAGGTLGREVVALLHAKQARFRASYFSEGSAAAARARGIEAVVSDYTRPETLRAALRGCDTLFLLGPNLSDQTDLEVAAVDAAIGGGVRRIVKQSVMGAEDEAFSLAKVHRPVERAIASSGLAWTFLRPNSFMQNILTFMSPTITAEDAFYSASGTGAISHVDVRDIAAVAVEALLASAHEGQAYTLTGSEAISYDQLAVELSTALGRPIRHVDLPPADLQAAMLAGGMPADIADRMLDLDRYFKENQGSRTTNDIRQVTGRAPRRLADYVRECAPLLQPSR
jgi:uncharacterized protein YbjT (DUF2867 family)